MLQSGLPAELLDPGIESAATRASMLEIARPETRTSVRAHPRHYSWGIVDVILALVMLPFAIWMWLIDRMVWLISRVVGR